jgi:hypothetical protein
MKRWRMVMSCPSGRSCLEIDNVHYGCRSHGGHQQASESPHQRACGINSAKLQQHCSHPAALEQETHTLADLELESLKKIGVGPGKNHLSVSGREEAKTPRLKLERVAVRRICGERATRESWRRGKEERAHVLSFPSLFDSNSILGLAYL